MEFFNQAIDILKILVMALGAGLAVWGVDVYKRQRMHHAEARSRSSISS